MTTIINPSSTNEDSGVGLVVGVLLGVVLIGVLFFAFVMPRIRDNGTAGSGSTTDINVTVPGTSGGSNTSGSANQ